MNNIRVVLLVPFMEFFASHPVFTTREFAEYRSEDSSESRWTRKPSLGVGAS